ncbi:MAG: PAS domain S-box protein [Desulfatibacillaceae bacterium]
MWNLMILLLLALLFAGLWALEEYWQVGREKQRLEAGFMKSEKQRLRDQVDQVIDFMGYMQAQTEIRVRALIRERVLEGHALATHLYTEYGPHLPENEVRSLIREALRSIRFEDGRGYYFAVTMEGESDLLAGLPQLERLNMMDVRDARGKYIIRRMLDVVNENGQGYVDYYWPKPTEPGRDFPKVSYVKEFEPLGWIIGVGEYLDNVEQAIREEVLNRIGKIRFGENGYVFVLDHTGTFVSHIDPDFNKQNYLDHEDRGGIPVVRELLGAQQNPEGVFVRYSWEKPGNGRQVPKLSYAREFTDWNWVVGAGVYLEDMEKLLAVREQEFRDRVGRQFVLIGLAFALSMGVAFLGAMLYARRMGRATRAFTNFFEQSADSYRYIDEQNLEYSEFRTMARFANEMADKRRKAESELKRQTATLRGILRAAPVGIGLLDGREISWANERLAGMLGRGKTSLTGADVSTLYASFEEYERATGQLNRGLETSGVGSAEARWARADKSVIDVMVRATPMDASGDGEGVIFMALDITDYKRSISEKERLAAIVAATSDLVAVGDPSGAIRYMNAAGRAMLGWEDRVLDGTVSAAEIHTEKALGKLTEVALPSAAELGVWRGGSKVLAADGTHIPVSQVIMAHYSRNGEVEYYSTIMRDVTEQKRAEEALRASERKFHAIFDQTFQYMALLDVDGRIIDANNRTLESCNAEIGDVRGSRFWDAPCWNHSETSRKLVRECVHRAAAGALVRRETTHMHHDGSINILDLSMNPVRDEAGETVFLIYEGRDITDLKRTEKELEAYRDRLDAVLKAVPVPLYAKDGEGRFVLYNFAFMGFYGVGAEDLIGRTPGEDVRVAGFAEEHAKDLDLMANDGATIFRGTLKNAYGDLREVEFTKACFHDSRGGVAGMVGTMVDFTDMRRAQQKLEESERRYRVVFEAAGDAIFLLSGDRLEDCNTKALEMFMATREEMSGATLESLSPDLQPDGKRSAREVRAYLREARIGKTVSYVWRHRRLNNELFDAEITLNSLEIAGTKHVMAIVRDITERLEAEAALRKSEALLVQAQTLANIGNFSWDPQKRRLYWSRQLYTIYGLDPGAPPPVGERHKSLVLPGDWEKLRSIGQRGGENAEPPQIEYSIRRPDGGVRHLHCVAHWSVDESGRATILTGTIQDITERRRAEAALRESEEKYRELVENANSIILRLDAAGNVVFFNEYAQDFFDYDETDVLGGNVFGTLVPDEERSSGFHGMIREVVDDPDRFVSGEHAVFRRNGEKAWVNWSARAVRNEEGDTHEILCVGNDVTERRLARFELEARMERVRRQQEAIVGILSHEALAHGDVRSSLDFITEQAAAAMDVRRVGIWLFSNDGKRLVCTNLYDRETGTHTDGMSLPVREYPSYFKAVSAGRALDARDALRDPRTAELVESYLKPLGVTSMLDAAIRVSGDIMGVICAEHVGPARDWHDDEVAFAGELADQVAHAHITSQRKHAEDALQESEHFYRSLFDLGLIGMAVVEPETGCWLEANQSLCGMLGMTREGLLRSRWHAVVHPGESGAVRERYGKMLAGAIDEFSEDARLVRGGGATMHAVLSMRLLRDAEGRPEHVFVLVSDITERKHAEEELAKAQALLLAALEQTPAGILIADTPDVRVRLANTAAVDIMGESGVRRTDVSTGEFSMRWDSYRPDGTPFGLHDLPLSRAVLKGETVRNEEVVIRRPNGEERWVLANAAPVRDEQGDVAAGVVVFSDITEIKRGEAELNRLRNFLSNIVNSMPSVLVGVDPEGRVTQWNREAERTTGVSAENARNRPFATVFPRLSGVRSLVARAIEERSPQKSEKMPLPENGHTRFSDITVYPLVDNGIQGAVIRVDDVTERVRIEEMMIQSEKMLSVGGLAAGMAHEINNPLAGMLQNAQVVINRVTKNIPANTEAAEKAGTTLESITDYMERRGVLKMLAAIRGSGERASRIVQNMLDFSRKSEYRYAYCEIQSVVDKTVELAANDYDLKKKYDFKRIRIEREYDADLPPVPCEATKIQQVLLNLFRNGAEAMSGEQDVEPRFILRATREENFVRLEVEDNGPGMPEEVRKRAFEPFFTTKGVGAGTGLGLSVSYFIITENHRGTLHVESSGDRGTRFVIRLPLEEKENQP